MSTQDATAIDTATSTPQAAPSRGRRSKAPQAPEKKDAYIDVAPREYDLDLVTKFLDLVFHAGLTEKGEVLTWVVDKYRTPVYPITEDEMFDALGKTKQGKALYYGTASVRRDNANKLFNRQSLFERLHVVVLDDVGTKGDEVPEALKPTYIVETSEGNFQYGYVLETPIDNLDAAKALVKIMYEAGIADAGGKMPNKLVRLPEGINGKKGLKCHFVTNLISMDGPKWTPQGLLDAINSGATWDEIEKDSHDATKRRARLTGGSTPWAPYRPTLDSVSGIIDPVAEWLVSADQVVQDNGEWLVVRCPWADQHTSGDGTAGYKPLGRGTDPTQRGFNCFHDNCATQHTNDYLQFVAALGGPSAGARDNACELVSSFVYDMVSDCAWQIKDVISPRPVSISAMRNTFPRKVLVATDDGKLRPVAEFNQWLLSESRVTVVGPTFDPTTPARLVEHKGELFVNQFAPPMWGAGDYDDEPVEKFKQYLEYLIPITEERAYFTQWLAAKMQNVGFRGCAMVMIAQRQGVGRSTLGDMIQLMLGAANFRKVPFEKVVGDHQYNDWIETPFIVSDETLNDGGLNSYKTYEKLKDMIDPRPSEVTVNPKFGKQRRSMVHSSFLFLSNHANALSISDDDRRFYVISNPHKPAPHEFFLSVEEVLPTRKGADVEWPRHVYRWLLSLDVDMDALLSPPKSTVGKQTMVEESRSDVDTVATSILANWPCEYISAGQFTQAVEMFADRLGLYDVGNYRGQLKRILSAATYPLAQTSVMKFEGKTTRFRVIVAKAGDDTTPKGESLTSEDKAHINAMLIPENLKNMRERVTEAVDIAGL